jgi:hypothetical protein
MPVLAHFSCVRSSIRPGYARDGVVDLGRTLVTFWTLSRRTCTGEAEADPFQLVVRFLSALGQSLSRGS